jgi:hypothetical protein
MPVFREAPAFRRGDHVTASSPYRRAGVLWTATTSSASHAATQTARITTPRGISIRPVPWPQSLPSELSGGSARGSSLGRQSMSPPEQAPAFRRGEHVTAQGVRRILALQTPALSQDEFVQSPPDTATVAARPWTPSRSPVAQRTRELLLRGEGRSGTSSVRSTG